ncbi:hypothetical protein ABDK96_15660 [Citricoccus nitrophenolicus]|uniref:Uncharacterized protein n=1 Tax=Citricoccus nitrophenolicus TaxID=863575 RepID=A0ABV0ILR0_9MICC
MRPTRFTIALVAIIAVAALLIVGIVYLFIRPPGPAATGPTDAAVATANPSSSLSTTATGSAWQTTTPATSSAPATPAATPTAALTRKGLSADELVTTASEVMTTWDTTTDVSPTDGYRRALPLFVDEYKDIFVTPAKPVLPEDWWEAAEHDATSTPEVQITDTYPQGDTTTYYVVASWTWHSDDGWSLTPEPKYMTFQVTKDETGYVIQNWTDQQLQ